MFLLAHRGNLRGPAGHAENSLGLLREALELGFGLETDIRRAANGCFYVSHDAVEAPSPPWANDHAGLWRQYPRQTIALNVKELGYEAALLDFLRAGGVLGQVFLFDFELLEKVPGETARFMRALDPSIRLAARVSDRFGETVEQALAIECAEVIWLDEFDSLWLGQEPIAALKAAGKRLYAISPEIHGFPLEVARRRWADFACWGVDGICTDFPIEARRVLVG
jgi:glycerophosphoryl diester phosphodiesterase